MSRLEKRPVKVRKHKRTLPSGKTVTVSSHTRKQKVKVGGSDTKGKSAEEIHEARSPRAQAVDESQQAEKVTSSKKKWVAHKNRMDYPGVDTIKPEEIGWSKRNKEDKFGDEQIIYSFPDSTHVQGDSTQVRVLTTGRGDRWIVKEYSLDEEGEVVSSKNVSTTLKEKEDAIDRAEIYILKTSQNASYGAFSQDEEMSSPNGSNYVIADYEDSDVASSVANGLGGEAAVKGDRVYIKTNSEKESKDLKNLLKDKTGAKRVKID